MASHFWSEDKEDILAAMWEERSFLYDNNLKGFNNRVKKDQAFREMAYAVGIPVGNVMKRMVSMRTQYSRLKNKGLKEGKAPSRKSRWLLDRLQFLAPFIDHRNVTVHQTEGDDVDGEQMGVVYTDGDFESSILPPRVQFKKREYNTRKRKLVEFEEDEEEEDPIEQEDCSEDLVDYDDQPNCKGLERVDLIECAAPRIKAQSMALPSPISGFASKRDQEQLFCDFIAGELREIQDPIAKAKLMNKIQNDVFNAKIGEAFKGNLEAGGISGTPGPYKLDQNVNCSNNTTTLSSVNPTPPQILSIMSVNESYKLSPTDSHSAY